MKTKDLEKLKKHVRRIMIYLEHDERRDWEECDKPRNHIYNDIRGLAKLLNIKLED